jgi:hypothetical protein
MLCYKSKISHTLVRDGVALPTNSMDGWVRNAMPSCPGCAVYGVWSGLCGLWSAATAEEDGRTPTQVSETVPDVPGAPMSRQLTNLWGDHPFAGVNFLEITATTSSRLPRFLDDGVASSSRNSPAHQTRSARRTMLAPVSAPNPPAPSILVLRPSRKHLRHNIQYSCHNTERATYPLHTCLSLETVLAACLGDGIIRWQCRDLETGK